MMDFVVFIAFISEKKIVNQIFIANSKIWIFQEQLSVYRVSVRIVKLPPEISVSPKLPKAHFKPFLLHSVGI